MKEIYSLFLQSKGVSTDTRNIFDNCIFFALKGDNFNGNQFAETALQKGASYAIVDDPSVIKDNARIILVENVLKCLQEIANLHRKQFEIPIIGITGSNGKTTTKELIASVLKQQYNVLYTEGNLNNHIGVPLTLLQLNEKHEIAIVEMGANHPGDIKELCAIAEPNFGIITNIGKAHLEGFINFEGVLKTKKELYDSIESRNGVLFFNTDDTVLSAILPEIQTIGYGQKEGTIIGELKQLTPFVEFNYSIKNYTSPLLKTQIVGEYNFYNFLASIAIGNYFGIDSTKINEGIENYAPTNNRSQVKITDTNTLIIDCYNANPTSMLAAIQSFDKIDHPNKLMIIGDMRELGLESENEHQKIISLIEKLNLKAILIGKEFSKTLNSFPHFMTVEEFLSSKFKVEKHLLLLKGSRGIQLEKTIETL